MERYILLEDGTLLKGTAFGGKIKRQMSEIVFNTSLTGYQEIISDPSYFGQTVVFTNPLIGNYGINRDDFESLEVALDGIITSSCCENPSNWRSNLSLDEYLKQQNIPGIEDVDTRLLTLRIREHGSMRSIMLEEPFNYQEELEKLKLTKFRHDHTLQVMTKRIYEIPSSGNKRIVLLDFGCKLNIIHELTKRSCSVIVVPGNTSYEKILSYSPDGIMLSNGPGDPLDNLEAINNIRKLIENDIPIFGICLGHQLVSLASGGLTYKMKFGHRGGNQPVLDLHNGKTLITSQNHSYAVDNNSLKNTDLEVTHINLNDKTIEGLKSKYHPLFTVQFHPEACAGPHDANYLFDQFISLIESR